LLKIWLNCFIYIFCVYFEAKVCNKYLIVKTAVLFDYNIVEMTADIKQ